MSDIQYCYSRDGEDFNCEGFGELIDELKGDFEDEEIVGLTYWRGQKADVNVESYVHVESILEQIDEWIYEDVGEIYDGDFSYLSNDAKEELKAVICEWSKKHVKLRYWLVLKVEELKITKEDLI